MAKVRRQFGEAVDTAGAIASAMERAYRLGTEEALREPALPAPSPQDSPGAHALTWTLIPPRIRSAFWSICLAALGREGRIQTPAYLQSVPTRAGRPAWELIVPDRRTYEKRVGDATIVTLIRLGLLEVAEADKRVILAEYGIRTWNPFCERGGHWPDDLVEMLP
jgi:hypothetical protein